jgi:hypothetical protein
MGHYHTIQNADKMYEERNDCAYTFFARSETIETQLEMTVKETVPVTGRGGS